MDIRSIQDAATTATAGASGGGATSALGQNEFLKLLVTQMRYQDPLSPMDNAEFTAQLAQFSSLEQLFKVNDNLSSLGASQGPGEMASVAGFIGREVLARGDGAVLGEDGGATAQFYLDGPAEVVNVLIQGPDGTTIRSVAAGALPGGSQGLVWDGTDADGNRMPAGTYRFAVVAQDAAGASVAVRTQLQGLVSGTTYENGAAYLVVDGQRVALADVVAVKAPTPVEP